MTFAQNLKLLPGVSHLAALQLLDAAGALLATIENRPGQAGSLAVWGRTVSNSGDGSAPRSRLTLRGLGVDAWRRGMRGG
jgi:hypothetical protein